MRLLDQFFATVPAQGISQTPVTVVVADETTGSVGATVTGMNNSAPVSLDANGNVLQDDRRVYQWDAENRLIQANYIVPQDPNLPSTVTMGYDGEGRRASINEISSNGTVLAAKTFVWCGNTLCQERDGTGATVNKQFFAQGEKLGGTSYYFTKDHLGSIRELTTANGAVTAQFDYDPYGNQKQMVGSVTLTGDFGFTGFHQEQAVGLDLTQYRIYDPTKGKWLSRDPMGEGTGPNLYAYAGNSPFNGTDPMGLYDPNSWFGRYLFSDQSATHEFLYGQEETQAITGVVAATASVAGGEVLAEFGEAAEEEEAVAQFEGRVGESRIGVNPRSLTPSKDLSTLDPVRVQNAMKYAGDEALDVTKNGLIRQGNHRLLDALQNGRFVDVNVVP